MMRIAHVGSKGIPSKGGTERVVEALARRHSRSHQVTVYGSARVCATGTFAGVRVLALHSLNAKHAGPVVLQSLAAIHALTRGSYDVVHVHGSENGFILPLLRLRYPVVSTNHGSAYRLDKWGAVARRLIRSNERLSVRWATVATAVSVEEARSLTERYHQPVQHIPNGVDSAEASARAEAVDLLRDHGLRSRGFILFAAARVDPTKGCHTLLEACRLMQSPPPLLVIGDLHHAPGYEGRLRKLAEGLPVTFLPRLDEKEVLMGLLQDCRVFVFPSTVEAMSMMLLEALAAGSVGIASDIPANTSILPETYPTFTAGDAGDLSRRLESVLAWDDRKRSSLKECGMEWVRKRYDWDSIAARYEELYRRACTRRTQEPGTQLQK
jgi:glycosyltransferase involved in cell wall biosynthesis